MPRLSLSALAIAAAVFAGGAGLTAAVVGVLEGEEARRRELVQQSEAGQLLERVAERFRDVSVRWRELDELAGLIDLSQPGVFDAFAAPIVANNIMADMGRASGTAAYDGYGSCPLTVERGKIVLAEFGYGGKRLPSFPSWLINDIEPSRLAWYLKERVLPPIYWQAMLKGREPLAKPKRESGAS